MFEMTLTAAWGDMDFNSHMRNTAYLDKAVEVRLAYFAAKGFSPTELAKLRIGPVTKTDEVEYRREVGLMEKLRVTLAAEGLADDGSRWLFRNRFFRADGEMAASILSLGGWLSQAERRLIAPPPGLLAALREMPRTESFSVLPSSVRRG
jgi:acyl-CoA thioester hydrolase